MKIAHSAIATPNKCGLYETTRELVAAERGIGLDARIVDPKPHEKVGIKGEDRGVPITSMDWAMESDIVLSHSGHDGTPIAESSQPIIHVAHGRPLSTFLGEREGGAPAYSYAVERSREDRYVGCVTFWPEYVPHLQVLWGDKPVRVVQPTVDLNYWTPGETPYNFAGKGGDYNVVMADPWSRKDVSPFHVINAFAHFVKEVPEAKLHIYGLDGNTKGLAALLKALGPSVGVVQNWASDLRAVYRAADMLITPHKIYTRSIREALACDLQVVSGRDCDPEDVLGFAQKMVERNRTRLPSRRLAEALFDPASAATQMLGVLNDLTVH